MPATHAGPTEQITAVLDSLEAAWASGDWAAYAAVHADDATYVAYDGTVMMGRQAIADGHRPLFEGIMRGSRLVTVDRLVKLVTADTAVVVQRAGIVMRWQRGAEMPARKRLSTATTHLHRGPNGWQVSAFQNTRFRPWVATLAGRIFARGSAMPPAETLIAE
ncbi:SgcJ/EcaC family oxidoreductase [Agromyces sp. GXQ0307]|uniref:SgcJ/EcaC family oxidoreductase n=1 Tax=Agromyces sp. GXQ0307 TaxID=3377835 RepID=UPI00383A9909